MESLIFDRALSDVTNKTTKGYWNVADITRIQSYIKLLSDYLKYGLTIDSFSLGDPVSKNKMQTILNNVDYIRLNWHRADDCPVTPSYASFDYVKANNIEKILQGAYDFYISVTTDFFYSGSLTAGGITL